MRPLTSAHRSKLVISEREGYGCDVTDGMLLTATQHKHTLETLTAFVRSETAKAGRPRVVIGLSGGIDSALSATIAVQALGKDAVFGLLMPYLTSSAASLEDAGVLARWLGIATETVVITPMVDAYFQGRTADQIQRGNKMARERMSILFDFAHARHALVLGTGNRTEIALGYTTLFGDSACSLNPIGDLYKTEVRALARSLSIPAAIIEKAPSADLWSGQTDEGEIGVTYELIDRILYAILDQSVTDLTELRRNFPADAIERVVSLVNRHYYKRQLPAVASLGKPTIPAHLHLQ